MSDSCDSHHATKGSFLKVRLYGLLLLLSLGFLQRKDRKRQEKIKEEREDPEGWEVGESRDCDSGPKVFDERSEGQNFLRSEKTR